MFACDLLESSVCDCTDCIEVCHANDRRLVEEPKTPRYAVYSTRLQVFQLHAVSVSAKLIRREAELLDRFGREYGFIGKSEAIRSAVRLYLNFVELGSKDRLRMLQLVNELVAPARKHRVISLRKGIANRTRFEALLGAKRARQALQEGT